MRAGRYVKQSGGYRAFIPAPLPPDPPVKMDDDMIRHLSDADRESLKGLLRRDHRVAPRACKLPEQLPVTPRTELHKLIAEYIDIEMILNSLQKE